MRRRTAIILAILAVLSTGVGGVVTYYEQTAKAPTAITVTQKTR